MECRGSILGQLRPRTGTGDGSGISSVKTPGLLEDFCCYDEMLNAVNFPKMRGLFSSVLEDQGHDTCTDRSQSVEDPISYILSWPMEMAGALLGTGIHIWR